MESSKSLILPSFIYSEEQVSLYLQQLDRYRSSLLQDSVRSQFSDEGKGSFVKEDGIAGSLRKYLDEVSGGEGVNEETLSSVEEFLEKIKKSAPRFHITLADIPGEELKYQITDWFRKNVHLYSLVSFDYDRGIAGGLILRTKNKLYDLSFKEKLQNPKITPVKILESENDTK